VMLWAAEVLVLQTMQVYCHPGFRHKKVTTSHTFAFQILT